MTPITISIKNLPNMATFLSLILNNVSSHHVGQFPWLCFDEYSRLISMPCWLLASFLASASSKFEE
jgi:hypothetical protein